MASKVAELVVKVTADAKGAASDLQDVGKAGSKGQKALGAASKVAGVALLAVGAAAVKAGQAAAEDAQSQAVLAQQMKNSTGAHKAQVAAMEDYISKASAASGVADDQLRPAMANLLRATGDATQSQKDMNVALDVAAATGQSVESVSKAIAKGYGGSTGSLKKLVPTLSEAALKSGHMDKAMRELAKTTKGASAASANTAAGKMQRFNLALSETQESIGGALLPVMGKLSTIMLKAATWAQKNSTLFVILAGAIAGIAAAVLVVNAAMKVYQATMIVVQAVQKATWLSNPIFLVVAAVALLVAGIVLLWKHSDRFRKIVMATWDAIKAGAKATAQVFKIVWKVAFFAVSTYVKTYLAVIKFVFGVIKTVVLALLGWLKPAWRAVWSALQSAARAFGDAVRAVWAGIKRTASEIVSHIKSAWSGLWSALKDGASGLGAVLSKPFDAMKSAIDLVVDAVKGLIDALKRIHVPKIHLPHIPGVNSTAALAPSPAGAGFRATQMSAGARAGATAGGVTIVVQGAYDPDAVARQIQRLLTGHGRRVGLRSA